VGCASLALAASTAAAPLELHGPETCSDREQLSFNVARLLGSSLDQVPRLAFRAQVAQTADGYSARLQVEDAEQPAAPTERQLVESSCSRLLDALAVVIVLAIHRTRDTPPAAPAQTSANVGAPSALPPAGSFAGGRPPETHFEPPAAAAATGDAGATTNEAAAATLIPSVAAWLWLDVGALPDPSPGLGLSLELTRRKLRLAAAGVLFPEQHLALPSDLEPRPGADLGLALGALSACYAPSASWEANLALGACVRGEAGRLYGRGSNVRGARSEARWWIAPGLDLLGSWKPLPALRLHAQIGVTAPLARTEFRLGELGELHRPAAVTFRTAIGVGFAFD
jgi:hypothetical protein